MLEGFLVCVIGISVVFVVLSVLMFMIMGMSRLLSAGTEVAGSVVAEVETKPEEISHITVQPEDSAETAAIALAVASSLKQKRGRELGPYITINNVEYHVDVGDLYPPPISVEVNGEKFWGSLTGEGLPVSTQPESKLRILSGDTLRGQGWRSAYPVSQGGYWSRRGWTGRQATDLDRK